MRAKSYSNHSSRLNQIRDLVAIHREQSAKLHELRRGLPADGLTDVLFILDQLADDLSYILDLTTDPGKLRPATIRRLLEAYDRKSVALEQAEQRIRLLTAGGQS